MRKWLLHLLAAAALAGVAWPAVADATPAGALTTCAHKHGKKRHRGKHRGGGKGRPTPNI